MEAAAAHPAARHPARRAATVGLVVRVRAAVHARVRRRPHRALSGERVAGLLHAPCCPGRLATGAGPLEGPGDHRGSAGVAARGAAPPRSGLATRVPRCRRGSCSSGPESLRAGTYRDETGLRREADRREATAHAELAVDPSEMRRDRALPDAEPRRDLPRREPLGRDAQDLTLTLGELARRCRGGASIPAAILPDGMRARARRGPSRGRRPCAATAGTPPGRCSCPRSRRPPRTASATPAMASALAPHPRIACDGNRSPQRADQPERVVLARRARVRPGRPPGCAGPAGSPPVPRRT